jgi:hypothetical protein
MRLRSCEQGTRHAGAASLPGPSQHSAHGTIHRTFPDAFQGVLAAMKGHKNAGRYPCVSARLLVFFRCLGRSWTAWSRTGPQSELWRSLVAPRVRDEPLPLWPKFPVSDVHEIATENRTLLAKGLPAWPLVIK